MPLRDHFRPPVTRYAPWEGVHGGWPMVIVQSIATLLPPEYTAIPRVHLGPLVERDAGGFQLDDPTPRDDPSAGGVAVAAPPSATAATATALWSPPAPGLAVEIELPDTDEYEVRVYDMAAGRRLVAAVEIVSPRNKDRADARRAFVNKCAALLSEGVAVTIIDVVTVRRPNLYAAVLDHLGVASAGDHPRLYAVSCRVADGDPRRRLEAWPHPLAVGDPLPTLPLWLADDVAIPLDLEGSYESTCRTLRIP